MVPDRSGDLEDLKKAARMLKGTVAYNVNKAASDVWPSHYTNSVSKSAMENVDRILRQADKSIAVELGKIEQEIFRLS